MLKCVLLKSTELFNSKPLIKSLLLEHPRPQKCTEMAPSSTVYYLDASIYTVRLKVSLLNKINQSVNHGQFAALQYKHCAFTRHPVLDHFYFNLSEIPDFYYLY